MRQQSEDDIQAGIVDYLRTVLKPDAYRVFAVPNGGARSKATAGALKRTGVLAGVWDVCILGIDGRTWWLETKTPARGLSKPQIEMKHFMDDRSIPHMVVRSIDDAAAAVAWWELSTRLARAA